MALVTARTYSIHVPQRHVTAKVAPAALLPQFLVLLNLSMLFGAALLITHAAQEYKAQAIARTQAVQQLREAYRQLTYVEAEAAGLESVQKLQLYLEAQAADWTDLGPPNLVVDSAESPSMVESAQPATEPWVQEGYWAWTRQWVNNCAGQLAGWVHRHSWLERTSTSAPDAAGLDGSEG